MNITELNDKIESFVQKHDLAGDALALKKENAIVASAEWQKTLDELTSEGRVLRIGVIGRVKAGKSSMLNALLFDGKDILPKAATPMTAALTIMQYGESVRAELDFFTEEDLQDIRQRHDAYKQEREALIQKYQRENLERAQARKRRNHLHASLTPEEMRECEERAQKQANRDMSNGPLFAAYDQHCRIQASGKTLHEVQEYATIEANGIETLVSELEPFVGAGGAFMPFTKSVTLHIPHEGLKGLQIIDTPGINDPVASRGARTEALLKDCDVVLVVSPAGQFLSHEDTDLLHRVTTREGTQEAWIVASQADNQLYGSERGDATDPAQVLARVTGVLTQHARDVLQEQARDYPEMRTATDRLAKNSVVCISSMAHAMAQRLGDRGNWDAGMQHVWRNLTETFPAAFADNSRAKATLARMANIEKLQGIVAEVTANKADIFEKRKVSFEQAKQKSLQDYMYGLHNIIVEQIKYIKTADMDELCKQEKELSKQKASISFSVGGLYEDSIMEAKNSLSRQMKDSLAEEMRKFGDAAKKAQSTKTESKRVKTGTTGWWLWKKDVYETRYYEVKSVSATAIRSTIEEISSHIQDKLNEAGEIFQVTWKKKIYKEMVGTLRELLGDGGVDIQIVIRSIRNILAQLPEVDFQIQNDMPDELKQSGKLTGRDCENFMNAAENHMVNMKDNIRKDIGNYINKMYNGLKSVNLADEFVERLEADLKKLTEEIRSKEASLRHYEAMKEELKELQNESAA